jgi:predicted RecA/RadA family phage recombinase
MATFVQEGETIDYTPTAAVAAGAVVVMGTVGVGVVPVALAANERGSLVVDGVVRHPKTAAQAVSAYARVYWDATNSVFTTTVGSNVLAGYAVAAAGASDATVDVKLMKV